MALSARFSPAGALGGVSACLRDLYLSNSRLSSTRACPRADGSCSALLSPLTKGSFSSAKLKLYTSRRRCIVLSLCLTNAVDRSLGRLVPRMLEVDSSAEAALL